MSETFGGGLNYLGNVTSCTPPIANLSLRIEKCIETICDSIPCVRSANMSIATNALYALLPHLVAALGGQYDIESVEAHHHFN